MIYSNKFSSNFLNKFEELISNTSIGVDENYFLSNFTDYSIINKGGFGIVIKGILDGSYSAIKIIPFLIKKDNPKDLLSIYINNKLKEVRCLRDLNHPNIVDFKKSWIETGDILVKILEKCNNINTFFDSNHENNLLNSFFSSSKDINSDLNGEYFIVNIFIQMELMDMSLKQYLSSHDMLNRNIEEILFDILNGVRYLHDRNIVHCDLKPENILLNLVNDKIVNLKIADFGLIIEHHDSLFHQNNGTSLYMPGFHEKITNQYDIYSLGIILYELNQFFTTEMERLESIWNLKNNADNCCSIINNKYAKFISNMIKSDPNDRPSLQELYVLV